MCATTMHILRLNEESSIELEVLVGIHNKAKVHGKRIVEVKLSFDKNFS